MSSFSSTLGIMVCRSSGQLFHEKNYYKILQKFGKKKKINVFVFFPDSIDWAKKTLAGFQYDFNSNKWMSKKFALPNYVYDRCFYTSTVQFKQYKPFIKKIKADKSIRFLGLGLAGKWEVYQILQNSDYKTYLPRTELFKSTKQLTSWLDNSPVILKPIGGSHGSGVIKVSKKNKQYEIVGRSFNNAKFTQIFKTYDSLLVWIRSFTKNRNFIIQQYLELTTKNNQPFDIRVLVQKNKHGAWETTGMATRIGDKSNITSNLHGGGNVSKVDSFLTKQFPDKASEIIDKINGLATAVPALVESSHGHLFEVGLDIGVDRLGNVWIIEVNSKPGRKVFSLLKDKDKSLKSLIQPIEYTDYLSNLNIRIKSII